MAMAGYPECMRVLIEELSKMPGVGTRTAERLAFYFLSTDKISIERLSDALKKVNESIRYCRDCYNLSENDQCQVCSDPTRDRQSVCVVEEPKDIITLEKSGAFKGIYHVLLGVLSPLDGVGPQDIKIQELINRIKQHKIREVIIATTSDTEGEATAIYLVRLLKSLPLKVTRLAHGVPVGSELEFADRATLAHAIEARQEIQA